MKYMVAGNPKMYRTWLEAKQWLDDCNRLVMESPLVDAALFPPYFALVGAAEQIKKSNIGFGPQNMAWEERGPLTGEVSPLMLRELGCRYVELGHHERRLYFNENDDMVARKTGLALAHGLRPLVCVGEGAEYREKGAEKFLAQQLATIVTGLELHDPADLIIAYEPRWAVGQIEATPPDRACRNCDVLREGLIRRFGRQGDEIRLLYGGALRLDETPAMLALENINGLFIGRASQDVAFFAKTVALTHQAAERAIPSSANYDLPEISLGAAMRM